MESKLKALKVADLRDILSKASVACPAKANKSELIARITASSAAVDMYHNLHDPKPKHIEDPAPAQDDLLAPPEEIDWGADDALEKPTATKSEPPKVPVPTPPAMHTPAATKPASRLATSKPASKPILKAAPPQKLAPVPASSSTATTTANPSPSAAPTTPSTSLDSAAAPAPPHPTADTPDSELPLPFSRDPALFREDPEKYAADPDLFQRTMRARKWNIPLVEPKPQTSGGGRRGRKSAGDKGDQNKQADTKLASAKGQQQQDGEKKAEKQPKPVDALKHASKKVGENVAGFNDAASLQRRAERFGSIQSVKPDKVSNAAASNGATPVPSANGVKRKVEEYTTPEERERRLKKFGPVSK
ncbi:hypothetical protein FISHEDRAFT_71793 [Fistulina hepatica ATCC 64428]|uniref:THO1-MOS11 C-terminal domain-containing protein n=1 Tax=Fistulina hepatica ATCC 64428 TaxID=1128425 RepID=A0A0D7AH52_9AGAR|nr:hypothetical protein FISHEDRAFT_71793 [Fistulina hepatica ATCC 64428]